MASVEGSDPFGSDRSFLGHRFSYGRNVVSGPSVLKALIEEVWQGQVPQGLGQVDLAQRVHDVTTEAPVLDGR